MLTIKFKLTYPEPAGNQVEMDILLSAVLTLDYDFSYPGWVFSKVVVIKQHYFQQRYGAQYLLLKFTSTGALSAIYKLMIENSSMNLTKFFNKNMK